MCWEIRITRAKTNPEGRVRAEAAPAPWVLLGEWVDMTNLGEGSVDLGSIHLGHEWDAALPVGTPRLNLHWHGQPGTFLRPGQTLRVHSGEVRHLPSMDIRDWRGVDHHEFAESQRFLTNVDRGGCLTVCWRDPRGQWFLEDQACYDSRPAPGVALIRKGMRLVQGREDDEALDIESLRLVMRQQPARSVTGAMLTLISSDLPKAGMSRADSVSVQPP